MPEGPEVSYLTHYINKRFQGKSLTSVDILSGRYKNHGPPTHFDAFCNAMPLKLEKVEKKGKVMLVHFAKGWYMIVRLGMTGWWYVKGDEPTWKFMRPNIVLHFKGRNTEPLIFSDFRNFGTLTITQDKAMVSKVLDGLATDVMSTAWSARDMISNISKYPKRAHQVVEDAIMNQHFFISGIGNYLKSEVLYDAKIAPSRRLRSLTQTELTRLFKSARKVSISMYDILMNGKDDEYVATMKIYRKAKDPYGNQVVSYVASNGRTTFWVPNIQK